MTKSHITSNRAQYNIAQCANDKNYYASGKATIQDNRPQTVTQLRLKQAMQESFDQKRGSSIFRRPNEKSRFQSIAHSMGLKYGVDTSGLIATHNSSFPETLNAEATIQGKNIHFAPGKDSDYNIRHEVAHAIDNLLHGVPKGNKEIAGKLIDTTREKTVDAMARSSTSGIPEKTTQLQANDKPSNVGRPQSNLAIMESETHYSSNLNHTADVIQRIGKWDDTNATPMTYKDYHENMKAAIQGKVGQELYDLGHELKNEMDFNNARPRKLVSRTVFNLKFDVIDRMVNIGINSGALRGKDNRLTKESREKLIKALIESHKKKYYSQSGDQQEQTPNIWLELNNHAGGQYKESDFVSTTYDPGFIYDEQSNIFETGDYWLFTIIEVDDETLLYDRVKMEEDIDGLDPNSSGFKNEFELSIVGGVLPDQIVWAYAVPMSKETAEMERLAKKCCCF